MRERERERETDERTFGNGGGVGYEGGERGEGRRRERERESAGSDPPSLRVLQLLRRHLARRMLLGGWVGGWLRRSSTIVEDRGSSSAPTHPSRSPCSLYYHFPLLPFPRRCAARLTTAPPPPPPPPRLNAAPGEVKRSERGLSAAMAATGAVLMLMLTMIPPGSPVESARYPARHIPEPRCGEAPRVVNSHGRIGELRAVLAGSPPNESLSLTLFFWQRGLQLISRGVVVV